MAIAIQTTTVNKQNVYERYYPYIGTNKDVYVGYDNGEYVFNAYAYFKNTTYGWEYGEYFTPEQYYFTPVATPYGLQLTTDTFNIEGWCIGIKPPHPIPPIPTIVEVAWYFGNGGWVADALGISLFGDDSVYISGGAVGPTNGGGLMIPDMSTFVHYEFWGGGYGSYIKSAYSYQLLASTSFITTVGLIYSSFIVTNTSATTGYAYMSWYLYAQTLTWLPISYLNTYTINYTAYATATLSYNPFYLPNLVISAVRGGTGNPADIRVQWVIARAYPPNGVMPSISTISYLTTNNLEQIYSIVITNTQTIATPTPFQQMIAIANTSPTVSLPSNIAYYVNSQLYNMIDPKGRNVYFFTDPSNPNGSLLYAWYQGISNIGGANMKVYWVKLPNGIQASSSITIYMSITPTF